jgi:TetR/AcrR family transcriptional repressor of nem operon
MARPREFDLETVLDRATRLFWQRGYGGTSLNDLEAAMGIGRTSIYAAFGGKEELFLAVVDHYDRTYSIKLKKALAAGGSVHAAVERYFAELLKAFADPDLPLGCLLTNVGVEGDRGTTRLGRKIAASIARTEDAFYDLLRSGQGRGEVDRSVDIRAVARYFVAATHGLSTMAKALPNSSALTDVVDAILGHLDVLLKPDGTAEPTARVQAPTHAQTIAHHGFKDDTRP